MPIVKYDKSVQLEFGIGDIMVEPGLISNSDFGAVCFLNLKEPIPIGTKTKYDTPKSIELSDTPVRMLFAKIESIDVIIRALEAVKVMMKKNICPSCQINVLDENEDNAISRKDNKTEICTDCSVSEAFAEMD